jgi:hypothetical protein
MKTGSQICKLFPLLAVVLSSVIRIGKIVWKKVGPVKSRFGKRSIAPVTSWRGYAGFTGSFFNLKPWIVCGFAENPCTD